MKTWWPLLLLAVPILAVAQAESADRPDAGSKGIYRIVDANGNVVFTDNPADKKRAEKVRVGPTNTMDSPPVERRGDGPAKPPSGAAYEILAITAPDAGANLRIPQDNPIRVRVALSPPLKGGHRLVILDNGAPLEEPVMDFPNPGEHTLIAQVRDGDGTVLIESRPLVFYVMRTTAGTDGEGGDGSALPAYGSRAERGSAANIGGRAELGGQAELGGAASLGGAADRATVPAKD